jgi:hypothetical protein
MQRARDQFLSGSRLASEQDGRGSRRNLTRQVIDLAHHRTSANHSLNNGFCFVRHCLRQTSGWVDAKVRFWQSPML